LIRLEAQVGNDRGTLGIMMQDGNASNNTLDYPSQVASR
jgi:hypothetical protein